MPRTLVVTNDFPPTAGGIQAFVHGLLLHQDPDSVVVYAPKWKRDEQFDAEQPFPVIRHRTSLMLPEPLVLMKAREIAAEYECDRVLFGAAAPLGPGPSASATALPRTNVATAAKARADITAPMMQPLRSCSPPAFTGRTPSCAERGEYECSRVSKHYR